MLPIFSWYIKGQGALTLSLLFIFHMQGTKVFINRDYTQIYHLNIDIIGYILDSFTQKQAFLGNLK